MTANFDTVVQDEGTTSNRYTILGRLAGGGMADIFLARSTAIGGVERHVVLKRVLAEHGRDPQFAKMFLDEARLASQLQHPNIAQVHDVGIIAGSYFFTMEYVHGKDVRALLQRLSAERRQLPLNLVLHIACGALAALHHAHERTNDAGLPLGIVHRDVSPSNVMVSYEGAIKLLDFGVAKATQNAEETRTGTIKGKIAYLSPEQCRTGIVDRRSDLYSIGILIHEMLTCRRLYRHESDFQTMNAIVNDPTPPPSLYRTDVPAELDAIVQKAMQKSPVDRYASAGEMLEAVEEVAAKLQLRLSAPAMSRFIRELFGDRKEPWKDLSESAEFSRMTITGAPLASLATPNPAERALAKQLEGVRTLPQSSETETVSELPALAAIPALPPPQAARSKRTPLLVLAGALLAVGGAAIAVVAMGSKQAETPRPPAQEHVSAVTPPAPPDAAVAIVTTAPLDAQIEEPVPTKTIAASLESGDWIATLQLCVARRDPTNQERRDCGIAACNAKQRGVALDYYSAAPASAKPAIERACRVAGIVLRQAPVVRPKKDPCETDPLSCQK